MAKPLVSVLMPTYKQASFIRRAIASLLDQNFSNWELLIIDDGSPDATPEEVAPFLRDPRLSYHRFEKNQGLGVALNYGLDRAQGDFIAYLPSDDVFYKNHLQSLVEVLQQNPAAILAFSGVRHHYNRNATGQIEGYSLQLVQTLHRKTAVRWLERMELVTDDLGQMFWTKLGNPNQFIGTGQITCEWVDHPDQRHKIVREPVGGINLYRQYYQVTHPLRFHTSVGNRIDEVGRYEAFRSRPATPPAPDSLKILLVGELAYNADRVLALEERGHQLYGLWTPQPYWYNTVGPLPFGHVTDLPQQNWREAIENLQPDVIYGLLNWQAVPFAHEVLRAVKGKIPFVWHYKEGPFISLEKGHWRELVELYTECDGQIYSSPEMRDWFETIVPGLLSLRPNLVLDGDLPKRDWFSVQRSPRISDSTGEIHTVVPGRPIGLHPYTVEELARQQIHLHFYGDFTHRQWREWIEKTLRIAPDYLHLHSQVDQENWVQEFSQYDAGWLHFFKSENQGELRRANWDDLNYPARLATLAVAGLPALQADNSGSIVATQTLIKQLETGFFFTDMADLAEQLRDKSKLGQIQANVWRQRDYFTFDYHADRLLDFFRQVIAAKKTDK